jgi:ATP-binding cassette subfamily B protein
VGITLLIYLGYMLSIHAGLTLACLALTPLLWVGAVVFSRTVQPAYRESGELMDRLVRAFSENVQGMHVVKGFALEPEQIARFAAANRLVLRQKRWIFWKVSLFQPVMGLLTQISTLVLLGYGGYLVIHGRLQLGTGLFVFNGLLQEFGNQIDQITGIANSIQTALAGAQRVFDVLDTPEEIASPPRPIRLSRARGEIRFEHVSFAYRSGQRVLEDICFEIRPGECVAIVGETGSGKSTLLSLIPRFYDAGAGRVLVDGIDVACLDLDDLRRNVGMVFQETFLFNDSVAANIAFGRPEATDEEIRRAARIASADRFVRELPGGYDAMIGERGSNLSGGQRQRLAIARALALDPPILLLDDATAAVDPGTEHEIQKAILQATKGRTTLLVAHRLSTLKRADRIIVLEHGRIAQIGTHEQLLQASGHYHSMAIIQSALTAEALSPMAAGG